MAMVVRGRDTAQMTGRLDTVYVNLGTSQGVKVGDYFRIFRYQGTRAETIPVEKDYQDRLYGFGSNPEALCLERPTARSSGRRHRAECQPEFVDGPDHRFPNMKCTPAITSKSNSNSQHRQDLTREASFAGFFCSQPG